METLSPLQTPKTNHRNHILFSLSRFQAPSYMLLFVPVTEDRLVPAGNSTSHNPPDFCSVTGETTDYRSFCLSDGSFYPIMLQESEGEREGEREKGSERYGAATTAAVAVVLHGGDCSRRKRQRLWNPEVMMVQQSWVQIRFRFG
ncbi:hypothetical protein Hanom_Chr12g01135841 [Helianthus anomalus]